MNNEIKETEKKELSTKWFVIYLTLIVCSYHFFLIGMIISLILK